MADRKFCHPCASVIMAWVILFAAALLTSCGGLEVSRYYERGAVATSAPIATMVGEQVFAAGGNAFDAAVAVGFALSVVHPTAGNIGGGGFAVIRDGATGEIRALDFRETAPAGAFETMYLDSTGSVVPGASTVGAKAAGVPGTVAGLYQLWQKYGTMPWDALVGMAASLADTGFIVDEYLAGEFDAYKSELTAFESTARQFFPGGRAVRAGEKLRQEALAKTLYLIAAEGTDGFYRGEVAQYIEECMTAHGGLITADDLAGYEAVWRQPVHVRFDSLDIYSMPPPSSGGVLIGQILKLLEPFSFSALTPESPQYLHLFCEASRLAFADRSEHLGDPDYYPVPVDALLADDYLHMRRDMISSQHASSSAEVRPGELARQESDQTTHYSVCDSDGNMVAVTYTLNSSFGSMLVVEGAGFLLNNEMDDFSVKPGEPNIYGLVGNEANKIQPNKRMLSSMSPTLVLKNGRPLLALGAPGGGKIITTVAHAILCFSRFGLSPQEMVAQPRVHHQWLPDILYLEKGSFDIRVIQELVRLGHNVEEREPYSDLQVVYVGPDGLMTAASDPRQRGSAGGI